MRKFYDDKLNELKNALEEKESERDQLLRDLQLAEERNSASEELKDRLREKQQQIDSLKKMQTNYKKQTGEASRNEADIARLSQLQQDVKHMKKRKADMQKELAYEKRNHAKEVSRLSKMVGQKDREINKVQKYSNQLAVDAEKVKAISMMRLSELAQLKKALRLYKRGVGLDPVLVGRRQARTKEKNGGDRKVKGSESMMSSIDVDSIRDYFDKKVASVVRKEALVDKLAKEWEQYFELNTRLKGIVDGSDEDNSSETRETLEVQIRFKNDNIRKLAQRVRRQELTESSDGEIPSQSDSFLFDAEFSKLSTGKVIVILSAFCGSGHSFRSLTDVGNIIDCVPDVARSTAARVLFGMIVRERRRVAALAKTASSLDERVQSAEKASAVSEAALRSYMDEHRQEVADLEQKQQDHILSLMHMVNEDSERAAARSTTGSKGSIAAAVSEEMLQKKLLVLANERVSVLEGQLSELRSESAAMEEYVVKVDELNDLLTTKTKECIWLEQSRNDLRTAIRQIRDEASRRTGGSAGGFDSDLGLIIVNMVDDFLHPTSGFSQQSRHATSGQLPSTKRKLDKADRSLLSPRLKKHIELMHSSDSDSAPDDDDETEWATHIMADLALIAEGKVPPSLNSPDVLAGALKLEEASVFDRLANPRSFTGTQKHTRSRQKETDLPQDVSLQSNVGGEEKMVKPKEGSMRRSRVAVSHTSASAEVDRDMTPKAVDNDEGGDVVSPESDQQSYQSVFDRLGSPSHFTGTQKEKFHDTRAKRDRAADEVADRVLCGILDENEDQVQDKGIGTSVRTEYTKQNVFDRLQKTTTHAAAIRQNETLHLDSRLTTDSKDQDSPSLTGDATSQSNQPDTSRQGSLASAPAVATEQQSGENGGEIRAGSDRAAYTKQNVFDRLQKTTTLAAAVRQSKTLHLEGRINADTKTVISPVSAGDLPLPKKTEIKRVAITSAALNSESNDYMKQNVFERLNKTTTEAYAKKRTNHDD
jgi:hypothetical protein